MGCGAETTDLILGDQKGCIRGCEEFKYLGVIILNWYGHVQRMDQERPP